MTAHSTCLLDCVNGTHYSKYAVLLTPVWKEINGKMYYFWNEYIYACMYTYR